MYFFGLVSTLFLPFILHAAGIAEPAIYHHNSNLQWNWANETLEGYPFRGNERVLDVGSGDGVVTARVASFIPQGYIVGIDVSAKMVRFAANNSSFRNMFFLQGDATNLPFYSQFDLVVSFNTLHWVLDQGKAFWSIYETLVPGGKLVIVIPAYRRNTIGESAKVLVRSNKWKSFFSDYKSTKLYPTMEECQRLIEDAGFLILSCKLTSSDTLYRNKAAFIGYLKPLVNFISHLPEPKQSEFLTDLADTMLATSHVDEDGTIHYELDKLEVIAEK